MPTAGRPVSGEGSEAVAGRGSGGPWLGVFSCVTQPGSILRSPWPVVAPAGGWCRRVSAGGAFFVALFVAGLVAAERGEASRSFSMGAFLGDRRRGIRVTMPASLRWRLRHQAKFPGGLFVFGLLCGLAGWLLLRISRRALAAFARFAVPCAGALCVLFYVERLMLSSGGLRRARADSQARMALMPFRLALERGFVGY